MFFFFLVFIIFILLFLVPNENNEKQAPNETVVVVSSEETSKLEEEKLKQDEELKRLDAEVERKKIAEEEERQRLAKEEEEKKRLVEEVRKVEEEKKRVDALKVNEDKKRLEEEKKAQEEKQRQANEAKTIEEERIKRDTEAKRIEEEKKRKAEEEAKLEKEKREAEEEKKRKNEEAKKIEEEKKRLEELKKAEEEKQRKADEAAKLEKEKREAEEKKRLEEEKKAQEEKQRQADEKEKREAEEKKRVEDLKKAQEELNKLEEARKIEEEKQRQADEEAKLEKEKREAEEKKRIEDIQQAQEELNKLEEARRIEETKKIEEEKNHLEEIIQAEEEKSLSIDEESKSEKEIREVEEVLNKLDVKDKEEDQKVTEKGDIVELENGEQNASHKHNDVHYRDESEKLYNEQLEINQTEVENENKRLENEAELTTKSTPAVPLVVNKKQQMAIKNLMFSNKYCADLNPLKDAINHLEPYYSPFILLLPEDLQLFLLESTPFMGLSLASLIIIGFWVSLSLVFWLVMIKKKDQNKILNNVKLNKAILELELSIRNLNFEKQTFSSKILEMEKELEILNSQKTEFEEKYEQLEEKTKKNEASERNYVQELTKKLTNLEVKYENVVEMEKEKEEELSRLRNEKSRLEESISVFENDKNNFIEIEKYKELVEKISKIEDQNECYKDENIKFKVDAELYEKQIENLQHEISLRDKSLALLQSYFAKNSKSLPTIDENDDNKVVNGGDNIDEIMNIANLQMKIYELEQHLVVESQNKDAWAVEKSKLVTEYQNVCTQYEELKKQLDEAIARVKRLETENKLFEELRVKDIERNVRKEFMLEAELKKKSSDAERAAHLLEQLRLKQERIQELEAQIGRIERATTSDRHNYEKQMHENRQIARKFEKESEEAKREAESARKEAKLWKDKFNDIEQYKDKLIRPVPNKISYIQPIATANTNHNHQLNDSNDLSPQSKSLHESSVERERPPSTSSNSGGYVPPMYNPNTQLPHGISPTPIAHPMYMRGMPLPMYRPPFPPQPFPPARMPFELYNNTNNKNTAPSPDIMSQYMSRLPNVGLPPIGMPPVTGYPSPQIQRHTPLSMLQPNLNNSSQQASPGQANTSYTYNQNNNGK